MVNRKKTCIFELFVTTFKKIDCPFKKFGNCLLNLKMLRRLTEWRHISHTFVAKGWYRYLQSKTWQTKHKSKCIAWK